jgi:hypothetical protein
LEDVRRPVSVVDDCLHRVRVFAPWLARRGDRGLNH